MDLILWRHAEAEDWLEGPTQVGQIDLDRSLTQRGEKQAARMAAWLEALQSMVINLVAIP